jgi:hypothetical protein
VVRQASHERTRTHENLINQCSDSVYVCLIDLICGQDY